jgi:hypothetical protein
MRRLENLERIGRNAPFFALEVRNRFRNCFNSDVGSVQWQLKKFRFGKRF